MLLVSRIASKKLLTFFFIAENIRDRRKWKRYYIANRDNLRKIIIAISVRKNIHITRVRVNEWQLG